jgi:hypothetical protein
MRRPGLLPTFAVTSLVPIALLGAVLGGSVRSESRARNLAAARQTAVLASRLGIQSQLSADQLAKGLAPTELARFDRSLRAGVLGTDIVRLKIWNRSDRIV